MSQAEEITIEEQERKRAAVDFQNVWNQLSQMMDSDLKSSCEFCYLKGRLAGYAAALDRKDESLTTRQPR